ncbi:MAG: hypothetical protein AAF581_17295 [Planctomycetota bacterium]
MRRVFVTGTACLVLLVATTGCFRTALPMTGDPRLDLRCDDALVVQRATRRAADERDLDALPHLIFNLRSDNSWVRMMSLQALLKILGSEDTRGFCYFAPVGDREHAVVAWEEWYDSTGRFLEPIAEEDQK